MHKNATMIQRTGGAGVGGVVALLVLIKCGIVKSRCPAWRIPSIEIQRKDILIIPLTVLSTILDLF